MENYHASAAFTVLAEHLNSGEDRMDEDIEMVVRPSMIELILATDMKQHFSLVSRLQVRFT